MSSRTIRLITAGTAIAGGVLSVGDKLKAIPGVPGWLTSIWPLVIISATVFNQVAHALIVPDPATPPTPPK